MGFDTVFIRDPQGAMFYNYLRDARKIVYLFKMYELHDRILNLASIMSDDNIFTNKSKQMGWRRV